MFTGTKAQKAKASSGKAKPKGGTPAETGVANTMLTVGEPLTMTMGPAEVTVAVEAMAVVAVDVDVVAVVVVVLMVVEAEGVVSKRGQLLLNT